MFKAGKPIMYNGYVIESRVQYSSEKTFSPRTYSTVSCQALVTLSWSEAKHYLVIFRDIVM